MDAMNFLHRVYWGNSLLAYLGATVTFLAVAWGFLIGRRVLLARLHELAAKTKTDLDDFAVELLGKIRSPECYLVGFYVATRPLVFDARVDHFLRSVVIVVLAYRAVTILQAAIAYGVHRAMVNRESDQARRDTTKTMILIVQGLVWVGAVIFVLDNLGFNVGSMVAGLGIGGVAVALAAQAVLGDLFAALAIFLDRPFVVGDFIVVGDSSGTVERIGIKTTRIRSLSGEMMVMGNSQLTGTRIHNYKKMKERRVVFRFGLVYATTEALLTEAPAIVRKLVEQDKLLRFDRTHFMNFGDSSLDFEAVYYVLDPDYGKYMDCHQRLLLGMVREFRAKGYDFAFPTRTLVMDGPVTVKSA
jgi:small-conductance mechanosensitive channel